MEGRELQKEVGRRIEGALPGSRVFLRDLTGEGNRLEATIVWSGFRGMSEVQRHRKVYEALEGLVGGGAPVHAFSMKTRATAPEEPGPPPEGGAPGDDPPRAGPGKAPGRRQKGRCHEP